MDRDVLVSGCQTSKGNNAETLDAKQCVNNSWEQAGENGLVVSVKDRKVRLSNTDSESLYTLCRRWIRNDIPRKDQHVPSDKPLPRPLCAPGLESTQENSIGNEECLVEAENASQVDGSVEILTEQDLLELHVKHARQIRARLREERLKRIGRYKQRLALLLPHN